MSWASLNQVSQLAELGRVWPCAGQIAPLPPLLAGIHYLRYITNTSFAGDSVFHGILRAPPLQLTC